MESPDENSFEEQESSFSIPMVKIDTIPENENKEENEKEEIKEEDATIATNKDVDHSAVVREESSQPQRSDELPPKVRFAIPSTPPSPRNVNDKVDYARAKSIDLVRSRNMRTESLPIDQEEVLFRLSLDGAFQKNGKRRPLKPLNDIPPLQGRRAQFTKKLKNILRDTADDDYHLSDLFETDQEEPQRPDEPITVKEILLKLCHVIKRRMTYYTTHLTYFVLMAFLGGVILQFIEGTERINFADALFMATSALTVTGLTVQDFSQFRVASQILILILIILGGQVLMTLPLVVLRRYRYKKFINEHVAASKDFLTDSKHGLKVMVHPSSKQVLKDHKASIEYHSLKKILILVITYWAIVNLSSILILCIYFYSAGLEFQGVRPFWSAIFLSFSAFNNAGFSVYDNSVENFFDDPLVLLLLASLIVLGNVGFPIALRFVVWCIHRYKEKRKPSDLQTYKYILKFPRRCFTHMFPSYETRLLLIVLFVTLLVEFVLFLSLDWDSIALKNFSTPAKILSGIFQSVSTRTAGFNAVNLSLLHPSVKVLYVALMYISAYPVAITLRNSNVSEIFISPDRKDVKTVKTLSQRLLFADILWIYLAFLGICIFEQEGLESESKDFTIFKVLFEIISAYGTVGLSLGFPGTVTSFCGVWRTPSKLILVVVMLLGRHRGLPESVDRAVQVPTDLRPTKFDWSFYQPKAVESSKREINT